jgi:hypothetical protein
LLSELVEDNYISPCIAESYRNQTDESFNDIDFDKLAIGSTYIPQNIAILQHDNIMDNTITIHIEGNSLKTEKKKWATFLYPVQRYEKHGATPFTIPSIHDRNPDLLKATITWQVLSMLSTVEEMYL